MTTARTSWKDVDVSLDERMGAADGRVGEIAGVLNSAHGALVDLMADALDGDLWSQWGVHTPSHWLSWKSGIAGRHARHVVAIARRRDELPFTVSALREGRLSLDQARVIAAHVPAEYEQAAVQMAESLTIGQLEATLPQYAFNTPEPTDTSDDQSDASDQAAAGPAPDGTDGDGYGDADGDGRNGGPDAARSDGEGEPTGPDGAAGLGSEGPTGPAGPAGPGSDGSGAGSGCGGGRAGGYFGWDDHGFGRLSATLAPDEAILFETALRAAHEAVFRHKSEALPADAPRPRVSTIEALSELARSFLAHGATEHPSATRFRIYAHIDTGTNSNRMRSHLGPVLPDRFRRYLSCDSDITPVWQTHGSPISVGRNLRVVTNQMRKLIEHRDGGCAVPGCNRTTNLDIHHIIHWEHGGPTNTDNLVTLCRKHHRQHHLEVLHITGNANTQDPTAPNALRFTDQWGRPLHPAHQPSPPETPEPTQAATNAHLPNQPYPPPTHERLHREHFHLPRTPPPASPNEAA